MATSSIMNSSQSVGRYPAGSIAATPRRHAGGVRRRDETPEQFRYRMDSGAVQHGQMPQGVTMPPMAQSPMGGQTRHERILQARMDGTFDAKVAAYNASHAAAGTGQQLDAAGNPVTLPKAVNPASPITPPTPTAVTPPAVASAPAAPALNPAQFGATAAAAAGGGPIAAAVTSTASKAITPPPAPRAPATFDGMTREQFFGRGMAKYGPTAGVAVYQDPKVQAVAAAQKPQAVTPTVTRNVTPSSPVTPRPITPSRPGVTPQITATIPSVTHASPAPTTALTAAPTPKPPTSQAPQAVAPPRLSAAQMQAIKNPQGLSARMNPPGSTEIPLRQDPIAGPIIAAGESIAGPIIAAGESIAGGLRKQAARNPGGLLAKVGRLTGLTSR